MTTQATVRVFGFSGRRYLYRLAEQGVIPPPRRLSRRCAMWDCDAIEAAIAGSPVEARGGQESTSYDDRHSAQIEDGP